MELTFPKFPNYMISILYGLNPKHIAYKLQQVLCR